MILIDGLWYFGGNRERGIGRYLDYYFKEKFEVKREERIWLVPKSAPDRLVNELLAKYGGYSLIFDFAESKPRQRELLSRYLTEKKISTVFLSSPFERPWSMLDFLPIIKELDLSGSAVVFDLLPLQFPEEILNKWTDEEQLVYQERIKKLPLLDELLAISPFTKTQLVERLKIPAEKITVLKFGLSDKWIQPPREVDLKWWREISNGRYVVTISGGEWRKNLAGTLKYFARRYKNKNYSLLVICRLDRLEQWKYQILAWKLGINRQVKWLGFVDERLKWRLLAQAKVFLFLSLGEGLGIPLLEAKKAKVPEIVISKELVEAGFGDLVPGCKVAD